MLTSTNSTTVAWITTLWCLTSRHLSLRTKLKFSNALQVLKLTRSKALVGQSLWFFNLKGINMETLRHLQDLIAKEELYLQSCGYVRSRQLGALLRKEKALYRAFNRAESLT